MDKNYFGTTDTGKVRDNNEDTFIAEKTAVSDFIIACVIDGVGGYSGGEIASGIARQSILQHLNNSAGDFPTLMKNAIVKADEQIMAEKQRTAAHENMACVLTLAVVDLQRNQFYYAHVGDTRLYLLRGHSLVKISKDQSFVGFMEDTGRLTEEQAMRHPKRNEINKALGFGAKIATQDDYLETGQSPFLPGDMLLLCSDGLSDMVNKQDITNILTQDNNLSEKATQLIDAANRNGGLDNITVVLVKNDNQSLIHEATKPAVKVENRPATSISKVNTAPETQPVKTNEPVTENEKPAQINESNTAAPAPKSNKGLIALLSVLCILFLAFAIYLLWQNHKQANLVQQQKLTAVQHGRNAQEIKLQQALDSLTGNTLVLTDSLFTSPIVLSEPLLFNKDSLFIRAENNIIIKSDSAFTGTAIVVKPISQYVYIENITFENFNTAISSQNNALILKNVQFNNCPNAIQSVYLFPASKNISGKLSKSTFKTDSLATIVNE